MHDPSATTEFVFSQSELVKAGLMVGPRVYSTGTILYGADGDFKAVVNSMWNNSSSFRPSRFVGLENYEALMADDRLGRLTNFAFRATAPLIAGETADLCWRGGTLWVRGSDGRLCMEATAA